jgi:hypothetical protein
MAYSSGPRKACRRPDLDDHRRSWAQIDKDNVFSAEALDMAPIKGMLCDELFGDGAVDAYHRYGRIGGLMRDRQPCVTDFSAWTEREELPR